ncbi:MAG: hypothetical protein N2Z20_03810 [Elusimicrobiales bacterium]|nr:hypothetical protein [Elusimicrobiales bacterium]
MKIILSIFIFCIQFLNAQTFIKKSFMHQGLKREFYMYLPSKNVSGYPVFFILHGGGGSAENMMNLTKNSFNALSHRYGFVVVYPQGYKKHFNDGRKKPSYDAFKKNIDDVGFFEKIVEYLYNNYSIDSSKVYFAGISNGAMMAFRVGCESVIASGIASVAASMPKELYGCNSASNPKVLIIVGTDDPLVPYKGGEIKGPFGVRWLGEVVGAEHSYAFWSARNGCEMNELVENIKDPVDSRLSVIKRIKKCPKSRVALYTIEGGGHTWPGGMQYLSVSMVGKTFSGFDAAQEIVKFFLEE